MSEQKGVHTRLDTDYEPRFDRDLARGKQAEAFVDDIVTALADQRGEVKCDAWWVLTNRLYVECQCLRRGAWHPSGIETTASLTWSVKMGRHPLLLSLPVEWLRRAVKHALERDPRNGTAEQKRGAYPTRGAYVYWHDILATRDKGLDEHGLPSAATEGG